MSCLTRKDFLKWGAATFAAGISASPAAGQTASAAPAVTQRLGRPFLICGADVLTMDLQSRELLGTDVLVVDGKIAEIAKNIVASEAEVIDAEGQILMPGMVDSHRHFWLGFFPGVLVKTNPKKYAQYQRWKMRTMVCMTADDFHLAGLFGGLQAIDSVVTSVLDYAHAHHTQEKAIAGALGFIESGVSGVFAYQPSHNTSYGPGDTVRESQAVAERIGGPEESNYETVAVLRRLFADSRMRRSGLA